MSLDNVLREAVRTIPECIAAGIIDLNSGMLLAIKTVDSHPQEVLDMLAAATGDLFQGENVVNIFTLGAMGSENWASWTTFAAD